MVVDDQTVATAVAHLPTIMTLAKKDEPFDNLLIYFPVFLTGIFVLFAIFQTILTVFSKGKNKGNFGQD